MTAGVSRHHDDRPGRESDPVHRNLGAADAGDDGSSLELADRVEAAVMAVPGVVALHGGAFGEVATYLPGRRVAGIAVRDTETEVHVIVSYGSQVLDTARRVQAAVGAIVGTPVNVAVEDVMPARDPSDAIKAIHASSTTHPSAPAGDAQTLNVPVGDSPTGHDPETNAESKERS